MSNAHGETAQRIAIWSLSPQTIGAYFAIFLVQYIPGIAVEIYTFVQQQQVDDTFAYAALEIIRASGPIGIGSAMNAIAIAVSVEAIMVLAKMLERQRWEKGRAEGIKEERKRSNAKLRALAKEYGIPEDKLPIEDEEE